eukprot:TRINITY_DN2578_c0_g1_i1.p1 TRINITY_DN2578_c0_g1~~TRINITY_DN2578_c0_g1_i1.p1  ORF type:complete len:282 (+),score=62.63 TRINITY_DN2578_c0_g1_i1:327-1172(+)
MVILHIKKGEESLFLFETTTDIVVSQLVFELVEIFDLRLRIVWISELVKLLVEKGPLKRVSEESLEEKMQSIDISESSSSKGKEKMVDDEEQRGPPLDESISNVITRVVSDSLAAISSVQVQKKVPLTSQILIEAINSIKKILSLPSLPPLDPNLTLALQEENWVPNLAQFVQEALLPENTSLWWANKELRPEDKLSVYIEKNEKTTIIAKLTKKGGGPPPRETSLDSETQKAMMAYYFKKQEEHKALEASNDDVNSSSWANPKSLKNAFTGTSNVAWKPS